MPRYNRRKLKPIYLYLIALAVALLDQASKLSMISHLSYGSSLPVIGDILHFTMVQNHGGAFGLFQSWTSLLLLVSLVVVVAIIVLTHRKSSLPGVMGIAIALQLGGALGNLIDRVRLGYVVDFIDFGIWPVFNVADIAITLGIIILAYYLIFGERLKSGSDNTMPDRAVGD